MYCYTIFWIFFCSALQWREMADVEKKVEEEKEEVKGGELVFCGATAWDAIGRRKGLEGNLVSPTRLRPLVGVNISFVASGCGKCPQNFPFLHSFFF